MDTVMEHKNKTEAAHGGDIYRNKVSLDFSVNLNPMGIPDPVMEECVKALSDLTYYPDHMQQGLREAIASMEGAAVDNIVCGNGASELIMATVHAVRPAKALITAPCYAGYRYALEAAGAEIREHELKESEDFVLTNAILEEITDDLDIIFLADPNNPSGRLVDDDLLTQIKEACKAKGVCLVMDECFLPLTARGTRTPEAGDETIYLRAFTKTLAIPGLRLGYIVCGETAIADKIRRQLPEWNISVMAQRAGVAAAEFAPAGSDYMTKSLRLIEEERSYLTNELTGMGIKVYPSDTSYLLIKGREGLYEKLLEKGILIRRCENFSGLDGSYFRLAIRTHEDNEKLIKAIGEVK
jgi:histidinol-phosphate/aromatic aminotransferase/cobyric acid decarboxylase-like protein